MINDWEHKDVFVIWTPWQQRLNVCFKQLLMCFLLCSQSYRKRLVAAARPSRRAQTHYRPDYAVPYSHPHSAVNKRLRNPAPPQPPPPTRRRRRGGDYVTALLYTLLPGLIIAAALDAARRVSLSSATLGLLLVSTNAITSLCVQCTYILPVRALL